MGERKMNLKKILRREMQRRYDTFDNGKILLVVERGSSIICICEIEYEIGSINEGILKTIEILKENYFRVTQLKQAVVCCVNPTALIELFSLLADEPLSLNATIYSFQSFIPF